MDNTSRLRLRQICAGVDDMNSIVSTQTLKTQGFNAGDIAG